jgi:hypothetical protein
MCVSLRIVLHGPKRTGGSECRGNIEEYDVCFGVFRCVRMPAKIAHYHRNARPSAHLSLSLSVRLSVRK